MPSVFIHFLLITEPLLGCTSYTPFNNIEQFVSTFKFHQSFAKIFNSCIILHSMAYTHGKTQEFIFEWHESHTKCTRNVLKLIHIWHLFYRNDISVLLRFVEAKNEQWKQWVHWRAACLLLMKTVNFLWNDPFFK